MRRQRDGPAAGFTLVELLVVVAVLSILAAFLLPALRNAKESAWAARCLSNIRQIGVAAVMYTADHDGAVIGYMWGSCPNPFCSQVVVPNWPASLWTDFIYAYGSKSFDYLDCPKQRLIRHSWAQPPSPHPARKYYPGYAMNHEVGDWAGPKRVKLADVKTPSQKVWFADGSYSGLAQPADADNGYDSWSALLSGAGQFANNIRPVSRRHRGGSNIVFFDGHAEWKHYLEIMAWNFNPPPQTDFIYNPGEVYRGSYAESWALP